MDSGVTIERLREAARALKSGDSRTKLRAIQAAQDALDAAKAHELAVLQESKDYELDGASSVTTWARNELRLDAKASKALVRAAVTMRDLPAVGQAAAEGRIRLDHVVVFGYGLKHIGAEVVSQSEDWLLEVAVRHEPAGLRQVMRDLREAIYPDELDQAWIDGMDRHDIQVNPVPDGWHVNGFLDITTGAKFRQVLDTLGAPRDADDQRPGSARRVEAFDRMLTQVLESGLPSDQGIRPQLSIIVDTHGPSATVGGVRVDRPQAPRLPDLPVRPHHHHHRRRQRRAGDGVERRPHPTPRQPPTTPRDHHPPRRRVRRTRMPPHPPRDPPRHLVVPRRPHRPRPDDRPVRPLPPPRPPRTPQHRPPPRAGFDFTTQHGTPIDHPPRPRITYLPPQARRTDQRVPLRT